MRSREDSRVARRISFSFAGSRDGPVPDSAAALIEVHIDLSADISVAFSDARENPAPPIRKTQLSVLKTNNPPVFPGKP
jgi:hypothetical protein